MSLKEKLAEVINKVGLVERAVYEISSSYRLLPQPLPDPDVFAKAGLSVPSTLFGPAIVRGDSRDIDDLRAWKRAVVRMPSLLTVSTGGWSTASQATLSASRIAGALRQFVDCDESLGSWSLSIAHELCEQFLILYSADAASKLNDFVHARPIEGKLTELGWVMALANVANVLERTNDSNRGGTRVLWFRRRGHKNALDEALTIFCAITWKLERSCGIDGPFELLHLVREQTLTADPKPSKLHREPNRRPRTWYGLQP
jgi:hypothetical protein